MVRSGSSSWKIAYVYGPTSPYTSGRTSQLETDKLLSRHYDVSFIGYEVPEKMWRIRPRDIYLRHGPAWLFHILLKLIKGNYDLFMGDVSSPETIFAFILSRLLAKPVIIVDEHWYWEENFLMRLLWPVVRLIALDANVLIVSGLRAKEFWRLAGIPKERLRLVNFDVSILELDEKHIKLADEIRKSHDNKKIVLYFGRLEKRKGVDFLIKAFSELSKEDLDVVLLIAGEGTEKESLQRLCKEMGLNDRICFAGFIDEENKPAYFWACDVFVCPSITLEMPEPWGIVVNEAISLGKPVVATTAVGCVPDLVRQGVNGYVVPEKDTEALHKAVKLILSDESLRIAMGKASKEISAETNYCSVFKALDESIKSVVLKAQTTTIPSDLR